MCGKARQGLYRKTFRLQKPIHTALLIVRISVPIAKFIRTRGRGQQQDNLAQKKEVHNGLILDFFDSPHNGFESVLEVAHIANGWMGRLRSGLPFRNACADLQWKGNEETGQKSTSRCDWRVWRIGAR